MLGALTQVITYVVPFLLVLTAIVIGLSVTAVMLSYAIRLYAAKKTLSIDAFTESKW